MLPIDGCPELLCYKITALVFEDRGRLFLCLITISTNFVAETKAHKA